MKVSNSITLAKERSQLMIIDSLDSSTELSRRVFIKGIGYLSLGVIFSTMLGGCESIIKQIENRPVRRRLRTGSAEVDSAIAIYRDAVQRMKALPASDPRSWTAQAALHGTVAGGFNLCQHGNNHFFSWHRAYVFYFERICQELTGEKTFGLPYWNWNQNPAMHPAFTGVGPLFHPRNNTSVAGNPAFSDSTLNPIFADNNFFTFSGQVEGTPHNTLHVAVGGDMASGGSAQDPVFWMHHCMVDYCWAKWNIELEHDNTNDASWIGTSWNHFVDGKGASVNVTAGTTILMPLLGYRYEPSTIGRFIATRDLRAASVAELNKLEKRLKEGADIRFDVKKRVPIARGTRLSIARPFSAEVQVPADDVSALMEATTGREERVFVNIESAELPQVNDFFIRVFINLPGADLQTPTTDPHFAGSFAFFGRHMDADGTRRGRTDFLVNVTETLQRLRQEGQLRAGEPIQVQLVAVPATEAFISPETDFTLKSIDLVVTPVIIHPK
jgi:tyrosinase